MFRICAVKVFETKKSFVQKMEGSRIVRADQTGSYAVTLSENGQITLYSNCLLEHLPPFQHFESNAKDVQFLPPSLGLSFITGNKDGTMSVYHQEGLEWKIYQIEEFKEFSNNLVVSEFPPSPRVGCISGSSIVIFDMIFDDKPHLLLVRRFQETNHFSSFGFSGGDIVWACSKNTLFKFKLSNNKPEVLKVKENPIYLITSPVSSSTIAVLFDNNSVSIFNDQIRKEIPHNVLKANSIAFSPLGTSLMIIGMTQEEWKEAASGSWILINNY